MSQLQCRQSNVIFQAIDTRKNTNNIFFRYACRAKLIHQNVIFKGNTHVYIFAPPKKNPTKTQKR